jgi:DNA-binding protein
MDITRRNEISWKLDIEDMRRDKMGKKIDIKDIEVDDR